MGEAAGRIEEQEVSSAGRAGDGRRCRRQAVPGTAGGVVGRPCRGRQAVSSAGRAGDGRWCRRQAEPGTAGGVVGRPSRERQAEGRSFGSCPYEKTDLGRTR
jgi:hypothetical protein